MHSNLSITDGVYGILSSQDVGEAIKNLGESSFEVNDKDLIIDKIEEFLLALKKMS